MTDPYAPPYTNEEREALLRSLQLEGESRELTDDEVAILENRPVPRPSPNASPVGWFDPESGQQITDSPKKAKKPKDGNPPRKPEKRLYGANSGQ